MRRFRVDEEVWLVRKENKSKAMLCPVCDGELLIAADVPSEVVAPTAPENVVEKWLVPCVCCTRDKAGLPLGYVLLSERVSYARRVSIHSVLETRGGLEYICHTLLEDATPEEPWATFSAAPEFLFETQEEALSKSRRLAIEKNDRTIKYIRESAETKLKNYVQQILDVRRILEAGAVAEEEVEV